MASECSFDVACKVDLQEVDNAVHQTTREISQRFDFKGSVASVTRQENALVLSGEDEFKLRQVLDILEGKLVKRQVPLKALTRGSVEPAKSGQVRQLIKGTKHRVQAQIQEGQVRVFGRDKDELQAVIQFLRQQELGIHVQFMNFRS
jgi:uncharacterized protein YajQ (UPF0234 family)